MRRCRVYDPKHSSVPIAISSPTLADLAWAAGFIEGEGSFTYVFQTGGTYACASQVNLEPLEKLQKMFGGSIKPKKKRTRYWKDQSRWITSRGGWVWKVCGARARGVAMTLYPLLSSKRKQEARELFDGSYINPDSSLKGPKNLRKQARIEYEKKYGKS